MLKEGLFSTSLLDINTQNDYVHNRSHKTLGSQKFTAFIKPTGKKHVQDLP